MAQPEEPKYFARDLPGTRLASKWDEYLALFSDAGPSCLATGEASALYLYSEVAIPELLQRFPDARLVVLLRDPIELAVSMHAQQLSMSYELERSFETAWHNCEARRNGQKIPKSCPEAKELLYDEIPLLGKQLDRALKYVPRNNIRWYFHEDFSRDPGTLYRDVLAFLGVPDDGRASFPRVNQRKHTRSLLLARITQQPPLSLKRGAARTKQLLGIKRWHALDALRRLNYRQPRLAALSPGILDEMRAHFRADVALLQELTGRNLQHWLAQEG